MPIDTDVETRMKCFGHKSDHDIEDCNRHCCFIEKDLCDMHEHTAEFNKEEFAKLKTEDERIEYMICHRPDLDPPLPRRVRKNHKSEIR